MASPRSIAVTQAIAASAVRPADSRTSATIGSTPAIQNAVVDALSHLGVRYDQRNIFDLARYLFPVQLMPLRFRPRSLYLGSSSSREVICSALIAKAFYRAGITIEAPMGPGRHAGGAFHVRHQSYIMPRDFDLSPNFHILKVHGPAPEAT